MRTPTVFRKKPLALVLAAAFTPQIALAERPQLEEVIVTAQKRAESLQDVPVSVTALGAEEIEKMNMRNSTEIAAQVPNLQISTPYGDTQPYFSLRGVGTSDYSHAQSSPVAMYVDQIYKSVGALTSMQVYDLERIEVLRGPQGTLYGKNATGGAANFITLAPNFDGPSGYVTLGLGNYNKQIAKGAYQVTAVEDKLAFRGAFIANKMDGWVENKFPGGKDQGEQDDWAVRLSALWQPTEDVQAVLRLAKSESKGQNYGIYAANIDEAVTGYSRDGLDFHENESNYDANKTIENTSVSLIVDWDFNDRHTLTYIAGFDQGEWNSPSDDDGMPIHMDENEYTSDVDQITQELRISSSYDGPFNWIGGVYWDTDEVEATVHYRFFDLWFLDAESGGFDLWGFNEYNDYTQVREGYAVYANTTYDFTDSLTLTFGLRYSDDDTEIENFYALVGGLTEEPNDPNPENHSEVWTQSIPTIPSSFLEYTPGLGPRGEVLDDFNFDSDNLSGKIGLDWAISDEIMAYVSFSTGYRSGAMNGQAFLDESELTIVDPEELEAWELGFKTRWFDNQVQLNGSVFYYEYTNQQFIDLTEGGLQILRNADESEITGLELELTALLTDDLTLRAGVGLLDAEYTDLELGGVDLSGNQLIAAPDVNFNLLLDWTFAKTSFGAFSVLFDTVYTDDQFFDAHNTAATGQESYWLANGRLSLAGDKYDISAWVKNMADEEYFVYGLPLADAGFGFDYMVRGMPRTYGIEFTYRF